MNSLIAGKAVILLADIGPNDMLLSIVAIVAAAVVVMALVALFWHGDL